VADATPAPSSGESSGSSFGFLGRKVGPFPVIVWGALAFGAYWWYTHYGPGAKTTATTAQPGTGVKVIEVKGPPGKRGPRGPADRKGHGPSRGKAAPVPPPVPAAAPMTATSVYQPVPTGTMDGSTYESGYPSAAAMEGAYVPAG
jgi:hypothetical protein